MWFALMFIVLTVVSACVILKLANKVNDLKSDLFHERKLTERTAEAMLTANTLVNSQERELQMVWNRNRGLRADVTGLTGARQADALTIKNLEQSVSLLSAELDRITVDYAKRVLGGTEIVMPGTGDQA